MEDTRRMMGVPFDKFMQRFTAEERVEIEAHAQMLIAEEMSLRDLRKALGKTQAQLARKLKKPQATVSRLERQSDMLISTLDRVVHALGGRVQAGGGVAGPEAAVPDRPGRSGTSGCREANAYVTRLR